MRMYLVLFCCLLAGLAQAEDVRLINSSNWVFRILQCDGVIVRGVRIHSFANENNDGIGIDGDRFRWQKR